MSVVNECAGELTLRDAARVTSAMELDADQFAEIFAAVREPHMSRRELAAELLRCARLVHQLAAHRKQSR